MNELLLFSTIIVAFFSLLLMFRLWGRTGIYIWVALASVIANIEVLKCVDIFGISTTLGNVVYGSTFLATDILSQLYGGKEARRAVKVGFAALLAFVALTQISLRFVPNAEDYISPVMEQIFSVAPILFLCSLVSYLISNTLDTYLYDWIGKHTEKIWLRNNLSTFTSQALDTILIFVLYAVCGVFPWSIVPAMILSCYIIKIIAAACDTPFVYLAQRMMKNGKIKEI